MAFLAMNRMSYLWKRTYLQRIGSVLKYDDSVVHGYSSGENGKQDYKLHDVCVPWEHTNTWCWNRKIPGYLVSRYLGQYHGCWCVAAPSATVVLNMQCKGSYIPSECWGEILVIIIFHVPKISSARQRVKGINIFFKIYEGGVVEFDCSHTDICSS